MKLRYYQSEAVERTIELVKSTQCNPIIALPTGTGKSCVIAGLVDQLTRMKLRGRILMLTHKQKLISQNFSKLLTMNPQIDAGINCAGMGRRDADNQVIYASIQSVVRNPKQFGVVSAVIIDECHMVSPKSETSYYKFLDALRSKNDRMRVIGLSATPYRLGQGYLTENGIFDTFSYDKTSKDDFVWFIKEGYLSPLISRPADSVDIDLSGVRKLGGEFNIRDLAKVTDVDAITDAAVDEMVLLGKDRRKWIVFATGIDHCENVARKLAERGIRVAAMHSKRTDHEEVFAAFEEGSIQAVVNAEQLITGFDQPDVDMIGILRATDSPVLHCQAIGRGTRPVYADGYDLYTKKGRLDAIKNGKKQNCLVLDFPRNTERLGPINDLIIPTAPSQKRKKTTRRPPVKVCTCCGNYVAPAVRKCPHCEFVFPVSTRIQTTAGATDVVSYAVEERLDVDDVVYTTHKKPGKPACLKVLYKCGMVRIEHYLPFDSTSPMIRNKAREWWSEQKRDNAHLPDSTSQAFNLSVGLVQPKSIVIDVASKYRRLLRTEYQ